MIRIFEMYSLSLSIIKRNMIQDKWKAVAQMPNGYAIEDSKGRVIAMTQCDEYENDENPITWQEEVEHANLISAAPDLLEALEKISKEFWIICEGNTEQTVMYVNAIGAINKAKRE